MRAILASWAAVILYAAPAWSYIPLRENLPDVIAVADSAAAIVVASCYQLGDQTSSLPAFSTQEMLTGRCSPRFLIRSEHGTGLWKKGERYILVLEAPKSERRSSPGVPA